MKRLTKRDTDGQAMMDCEKCKAEWTGKHGKPMADCTALYCRNRLLDRLVKYEDTGLTPESVEALKLSMMGKAISEIKEFNGLPIDRLRELAEADKEGRVVVLPCKVGATVYTEFCGEIIEKYLGQFHVNGYTEPRLWADIDCGWTSTQHVRWDLEVGKTVFLNRKEAEEALKEVHNG